MKEEIDNLNLMINNVRKKYQPVINTLTEFSTIKTEINKSKKLLKKYGIPFKQEVNNN